MKMSYGIGGGVDGGERTEHVIMFWGRLIRADFSMIDEGKQRQIQAICKNEQSLQGFRRIFIGRSFQESHILGNGEENFLRMTIESEKFLIHRVKLNHSAAVHIHQQETKDFHLEDSNLFFCNCVDFVVRSSKRKRETWFSYQSFGKLYFHQLVVALL
jgi:hypothetical protein